MNACFVFFLIGFGDSDSKWAVTVWLLRRAERDRKGKLFACRCWSLRDCCWLIAASAAGGCSPCLCFILRWFDHPRPQTCGNAALPSWFACGFWANQRDKLKTKKPPGQQAQLSAPVRSDQSDQRADSTVARDAGLLLRLCAVAELLFLNPAENF